MRARDIRGGDDDFGIDQLLVEGRVLAVLVGGGHHGVALVFQPLADAELILRRAEQPGDLSRSHVSLPACLLACVHTSGFINGAHDEV